MITVLNIIQIFMTFSIIAILGMLAVLIISMLMMAFGIGTGELLYIALEVVGIACSIYVILHAGSMEKTAFFVGIAVTSIVRLCVTIFR